MVREVERAKGTTGFNALTGELEDLVKAGIIDPAKVTRSALQNAASIAGLLLTTGGAHRRQAGEGRRRPTAAAAMAGAGGGMGMM